MSAVLRLYPRAWRERYGDELAALLAEHPASPGDQIDLIRGAIDAHLHPQVPGADVSPDEETSMDQRRLGVVAALGGIAWILAAVSVVVLPLNADGERDLAVAIIAIAVGMVLTGVALGELGTRPGSPASTQTGHFVAGAGAVFAAMMLLPWPFIAFAVLGFPALAIVAAVRGARNGALPGWLAIVLVVGSAAMFVGTMGPDVRDSGTGPFLIGSIGLAALVLAGWAFSARTSTPELSNA